MERMADRVAAKKQAELEAKEQAIRETAERFASGLVRLVQIEPFTKEDALSALTEPGHRSSPMEAKLDVIIAEELELFADQLNEKIGRRIHEVLAGMARTLIRARLDMSPAPRTLRS
jgi:hypothetical protein